MTVSSPSAYPALRPAVTFPSSPPSPPSRHQSFSTYAKINGATIVASLWIMNLGVSTSSLPHVIFSFGTAPE